MKQNQLLSLVFVVACGFTSNLVLANSVSDKYKTHSGTECEQTHNTGKNLEFGIEGEPDPVTGQINGKFMITLNVELGRGSFNSKRIDCRQTMLYEQDRMYLENERLKLELELLRRKVEGDPGADQKSASSAVTDGDDW